MGEDQRTERDDLSPVITRAESIIYRHKFEGAAAGLLNASIIARDLGLADRTELRSAISHEYALAELERLAGQAARVRPADDGEST